MYRASKISVAVIVLAVVALSSCKKDTGTPTDLGYDYYPVEVGSWIIYDVDSIVHNNFTGNIDTFTFQVRELIQGLFVDNEGRNPQRIERWKKANDTSAWVLQDVWHSIVTTTTAEKTEEDLRYIKLVFPVKEGKIWNGNAYNTLDDWEYEYRDVNQPGTYGLLSFDSTLTVIQIDNPLLISNEYSEECFAKGVGLIYKRYIFLDFQNIKPGLEYTLTINSYGKN